MVSPSPLKSSFTLIVTLVSPAYKSVSPAKGTLFTMLSLSIVTWACGKLLNKLKPLRQDGAAIEGMFVCVLALVEHADDPLPQIFQGIWKGEILAEARGENGFGYDPLFWLPELGVSSAEMSKAEKNKISHRGQAMQLFKPSLQA